MTDGQYRHVLPRGAMLGDVKYGHGLRRREAAEYTKCFVHASATTRLKPSLLLAWHLCV